MHKSLKIYPERNKKPCRNGLTLMELMVVVLIIAILAGVAIPMMKGKVDKSKWTEANAAAGMIRNAVTAYYAETNIALSGNMGEPENQQALGIKQSDLDGTYFQASNYEIDNVDENGVAIITVTASKKNAPVGSRTLKPDGLFQ